MVTQPTPTMEKEGADLQKICKSVYKLYGCKKLMSDANSVVLPMGWISEENIVEPNGWVDKRYLDPTFSLLPVKPPEVNTLSLPRSKNYPKPVGHKLKTVARYYYCV